MGQVHGVLINLHGAMVAEDDDDPELTLLRAVRRRVGDVPIAAVLDLHANPSPDLVGLCDVVISYDTYPHVDMRQRGREAAAMLSRMIQHGERLETSLAKIPLLASPLAQATDSEPMSGLQARACLRGKAAGLERVCVVGGFAYSDVARAGMSVLAVHGPAARATARDVLSETAHDIEEHAANFEVRCDEPGPAVARAMNCNRRPVILVDVADNVGAGSPGDGTELLRELVRQGARGALVMIADPEAARAAAAVGTGHDFVGCVGAKADDRHGSPQAVRGRVVHVGGGQYHAGGTWMSGRQFDMGTTAVIETGGNTIVLTEHRVPPFHVEQVTSQGIEPGSMNFIVVKGAIAWRAAFGAIGREVIEVATPGVCPVDPMEFGRTTVPMTYP